MTDKIPPGYSTNSPAQTARLQDAALVCMRALSAAGLEIPALAIVFAMPDGTIAASIAGDSKNLQAMAKIMDSGPEVLRVSVERALQGKGHTKVVPL